MIEIFCWEDGWICSDYSVFCIELGFGESWELNCVAWIYNWKTLETVKFLYSAFDYIFRVT